MFVFTTAPRRQGSRAIWDPSIVGNAAGEALRKLQPRTMARNPVMFVVEVGSVLTTAALARDVVAGAHAIGFELQITCWLYIHSIADLSAGGRR